jgi:hypothetical protein
MSNFVAVFYDTETRMITRIFVPDKDDHLRLHEKLAPRELRTLISRGLYESLSSEQLAAYLGLSSGSPTPQVTPAVEDLGRDFPA